MIGGGEGRDCQRESMKRGSSETEDGIKFMSENANKLTDRLGKKTRVRE